MIANIPETDSNKSPEYRSLSGSPKISLQIEERQEIVNEISPEFSPPLMLSLDLSPPVAYNSPHKVHKISAEE